MDPMKSVRVFAVLLVAALALAACAKPPEAAIGQAREALKAAETAGAAKYAPEAWNRAKQSEAALDAELLGQSGKFALLRGYKKAAALAEELAASATQATADAVRKTGELRTELSGAISELRSLLQTARNRLASIPATARVDRAALRARLNGAADRIEQAQSALEGGRFDEALSGTADAREGLRGVLRTLEAAAPPPPSKKR
jgi:hypothetical protein